MKNSSGSHFNPSMESHHFRDEVMPSPGLAQTMGQAASTTYRSSASGLKGLMAQGSDHAQPGMSAPTKLKTLMGQGG